MTVGNYTVSKAVQKKIAHMLELAILVYLAFLPFMAVSSSSSTAGVMNMSGFSDNGM